MRNRSIAIIAENINDYISQMEIARINYENENKNDIKLFDFDLLSLNESKKIFNSEENDLLSSKKTYRICFNDITKKMKNSSKKRIFFHSKNFIFSLYGFKKFFYNL